LDPANYISSPGLAWDAMLLNTGVSLQNMTDLQVLDIMERQKKGGLTFVGAQRHVKANNKYMENYDSNKESNYIMYLDANNLYGWAMSQFLPYDDVKINKEITIDEILNTSDENETGYVIECDLHFPSHIHEKLKQFPPAPENIVPEDEWLSDYQKEIKKNKTG